MAKQNRTQTAPAHVAPEAQQTPGQVHPPQSPTPTVAVPVAPVAAPVQQPAAPPPRRARAAAAPAPQPAAAPVTETAVAQVRSLGSNLPAMPVHFAAQLEADAGLGMETASGDDFAVPFLSLLQSLSPQVTKGAPGFNELAEVGDFFDTSTGELWGGEDGIEVIPCVYERQLVEWIPRNRGGGFVAVHGEDSPIVAKAVRQPDGSTLLPNGNELVDTARFYCLAFGERGWSPVLVTFQKGGRKVARKWLTTMRSQKLQGAQGVFTPAMCAFSYRLTSATETNDRGTFCVVQIGAAALVQDADLYKAASEFARSVRGGSVRTSEPLHAQGELATSAAASVASAGGQRPF